MASSTKYSKKQKSTHVQQSFSYNWAVKLTEKPIWKCNCIFRQFRWMYVIFAHLQARTNVHENRILQFPWLNSRSWTIFWTLFSKVLLMLHKVEWFDSWVVIVIDKESCNFTFKCSFWHLDLVSQNKLQISIHTYGTHDCYKWIQWTGFPWLDFHYWSLKS